MMNEGLKILAFIFTAIASKMTIKIMIDCINTQKTCKEHYLEDFIAASDVIAIISCNTLVLMGHIHLFGNRRNMLTLINNIGIAFISVINIACIFAIFFPMYKGDTKCVKAFVRYNVVSLYMVQTLHLVSFICKILL